MKNQGFIKIASIIITIIFIALLFTQISIQDIITTLSRINPLYLLAGFGLYSCTYLLRAWRFHVLLNKEVGTKDLFSIECVHNMMNNLLPARTGELSYIYLLKTEQNKTTGEGLATLIIARIFDFMIISIFFLLFFAFVKNLITDFSVLIGIGILFLFFLIILLLGLLFYGKAFLTLFKQFARYMNFEKVRLGDYITKRSEETLEGFEKFKAGTTSIHTSVILFSTGIWILEYSLFYLIATSLGISLEPVQIFFASSFAIFSTVLPIQGIGGFGTTEAGWALGFISVGVPTELAISSGFAFHLLILLYTLILGGMGYVKIRSARKTKEKK
jgi:uncharacterized protein (TIRG00374 family)